MKKTTIVLLIAVGLLAGLLAGAPAAARPPEPEVKAPPGATIRDDVIDIGPYIRDAKLPIKGEPKLAAKAVIQPGYVVGDERDFLYLDDYLGFYGFTTYTVMAITEHCEIWVENTLYYYDIDGNVNLAHPDWPEVVTDEMVDYMAQECEETIYPTGLTYFGTPDEHNGDEALLVAWGLLPPGYYEGDGENIILLVSNVGDERMYDPTYPYYIAGFYSSAYEAYGDRNFITIDCKDWEQRLGPEGYDWGVDGKGPVSRPHVYEYITVHEFQHLIHDDYDPNEDSWVNEGCSMYSEYLAGYLTDEFHGETRFLDWPENSLVVWEDQPLEVLADYQQVYLWTLRMGEKYGPTRVKDLVAEPENGILGVNAVYTETTFLDEFNGFRDEILWGDSTSSFPAEWGWGVGITPDFDMGRLLRNLDNDGYDTPGAPPFGTDYIKTTYGPGLGAISFDGDEAPPPTRWEVTADLPIPATGDVAGNVLYSDHADEDDRLVIFPVSVPTDTATLSFDTFYNIEDDWDYGFVQVTTDTTGGTGFTSLSNTDTVTTTDPSAHPIIVDNVPGLTSLSSETEWVNEVFDLSAYAGQDILLAFRYATDWASAGSSEDYPAGWYVDNVKVGDTFLFTEELPVNAMSIKQVRGWTPDFRVSIFTYEHSPAAPGWASKDEMTITPGTLTGSFDLSAVLADTSEYAVVAISGMSPLMDGIIGSGLTPQYIPYTLTGMPGSIATSDVETYAGKRALIIYPGDIVTYTISVRNTGDAAVTDVTVTNPVPDHTAFMTATNGASLVEGDIVWTGDVSANSTAEIDFVVQIDDCVAPDTEIDNVTTFDDGLNPPFDRKLSNDVDSPFAASYITGPEDAAEVGDLLAYTMGLINSDSVPRVADVRMPIPEGTSFEYINIGGLGASAADDEIRFIVTVPPYAEAGAPMEFDLVFRVEPGAKSPIAVTGSLYELGCTEPYHTMAWTTELMPYRIHLPFVAKSYTPPIKITVLHTNDEHGWLQTFAAYGSPVTEGGAANLMARFTEFEGYSLDADGYLLTSGGDNWTGPSITTWFEGEPMVEVMNAMGYDVSVIGNHEFDFGRDVLNERIAEADYPFLSANIYYSGTTTLADFVTPYVVKDVSGVKVGLVGLTTRDTETTTHPKNIGDLDFGDYEEALRREVPNMEAEGAELIVVVGHVCLGELADLAANVGDLGIDLMEGGHCHELGTRNTNGIPIIGGGDNMQTYAKTVLFLDPTTHDVVDFTQSLVRNEYVTDDGNPVTPDATVQAIVDYWQAEEEAALGEVIGYTEDGIDRGSWEQWNYVTDSWLWAYPAGDFALTNTGGFRAGIDAGDITMGDIVGVLPFDNVIVDCEITGAQLVENLEVRDAAVGGFTYTYHEEDGQRIVDTVTLLADGSPLDMGATYHVLTNDFMYDGGDGFLFGEQDPDAYNTAIQWRQPVIDWTKAQNTDVTNPIDALLDDQPRAVEITP